MVVQYKLFKNPFEHDLPIDSLVVAEIVGNRTPDCLHREPYLNFSFPMFDLHVSLSIVSLLLSQFLSSDGQFSFPLKDCVEVFSVS